jgi:hypothetical protein
MTSDLCVLAPTVRDSRFFETYVSNAKAFGFDLARITVLFITEDEADRKRMESYANSLGLQAFVYGAAERELWFRENSLAEYSDLIPRRSHAETSFGLLWAWNQPSVRYVVLLDDDTVPIQTLDYFGKHIKNLEYSGTVTRVSSDKNWVNVLFQNFERHRLYPRGYPYSCMGETVRLEERSWSRRVYVSQGLWTVAPDIDAVRALVTGSQKEPSAIETEEHDFPYSFTVAPGHFLTVSSMNLAVRRSVIPAFYQLPMDDNPYGIGRFDDIWSGVFLKRILDSVGGEIMTGHPLCQHHKAPRNIFRDLLLESSGLELNEHLWKLVLQVEDLPRDFFRAYEALAHRMIDSTSSYKNSGFLKYMGTRMLKWTECCRKIKVS